MTAVQSASPSIRTRTFALAGNPNSGKTTIFNALTGLRQKTGNYAGVTVEKRVGRCKIGDEWVDIIDLPGTYSLIARSPDERIAVDVLAGRIAKTARPDAVIVVIDASNLQRNLYLLSQFIETGVPVVVALNMMDIAERRGTRVQAEVLAEKLGVPVVPIVGHKSKGIEELKRALNVARPAPEPAWPLPEVFNEEIERLTAKVEHAAQENGLLPRAFAERLIVGEEPIKTLDGIAAAGVMAARDRLKQAGIDPMQADVEAHYRWIEGLASSVTTPVVDLRVRGKSRGTGVSPVIPNHGRDARATKHSTFTDKVDRILLHKVLGLIIFAAIMGGVFVSIFWIAKPIMDGIQGGITAIGKLAAMKMPDGVLKDLWTDGIVAGVGSVMVFIPQIAILFAFLAILEDSGYLARAAFLMDRLLAKVGLSGKAFVPLLSGFACAIPGVMATRTMESRRDRLATIFVLPFMSCSARLPVYGLLIGTFFATYSAIAQGGIMLSLYLIGIIAAFATSWFFKKTVLKGAPASFILELPTYKFPQATQVLRTMLTNTWQFIAKAGTIIFCLSVILWAMNYWPHAKPVKIDETGLDVPQQYFTQINQALRQYEDDHRAEFEAMTEEEQSDAEVPIHEAAQKDYEDKATAEAQQRGSIAGIIGHGIEPAIAPLGYDWKMGVGLVGAFAAREVFVSTMGIVYAGNGDDENTTELKTAMQNDRYPDGRKVWTPLVAASLLVWFVLAMQCMSTLAIVKRETGGWKWPLIQLAYMNGLAYVVCLAIYQIGHAMGG